ncbi:MAG: glycoside hydrolase family 97 protein, partial [Actinobacteria bacterium]|nr:glycoside hydrolase family 97 protein [Actinomycetota bacterium]
VLAALLSCQTFNAPLEIASPDQKVQITFNLSEEQAPVYSVTFNGHVIVAESPLGIEFKQGGLLSAGLKITGVKRNTIDETYKLVVGKTKEARNNCNELTVSLQEVKAPKRKLDLVFRAYNDGVAFRYIIPKQKPLQDFDILAEKSTFNFPGNYTCWALQLGSFTSNYEKEFDQIHLNDLAADAVVGLPLTISVNDSLTLAIAEANLTDYAGMYLGGSSGNMLVSKLSPLPNGNGVCVKGSAPHASPWRVVMIGEKPGDLIESNIILNLNEPCAIADPSWIKPGKVAWPWWSGRMVTGENFKGGMNTATMEHYVDFAADAHLQYLLIDAKWYGDHKDVAADITTTIPEVDLLAIVDYAGMRNVGVILWLNWRNARKQMDQAFPLYEKWGIKGVKIDYMDRDDQEMVNIYREIVSNAAAHHLLVDFHGAYKPTGVRRTWPNLITREGVMGMEYAKWSDRITPEHTVTSPFTRMLAGPMDFTPGAFHNVTKKNFKSQGKAPMTMGTRCNQLAMFVVYESPLQMLCDSPGAYRGQEGLDFLKSVPTTWDETHVITAKVGDFIAIARKKGGDWFIGAMTDWTPRTLKLPLTFLGKGEYSAVIYSDGPGAERIPTRVSITKTKVTAEDVLTANLAAGGGYAVQLVPVK